MGGFGKGSLHLLPFKQIKNYNSTREMVELSTTTTKLKSPLKSRAHAASRLPYQQLMQMTVSDLPAPTVYNTSETNVFYATVANLVHLGQVHFACAKVDSMIS